MHRAHRPFDHALYAYVDAGGSLEVQDAGTKESNAHTGFENNLIHIALQEALERVPSGEFKESLRLPNLLKAPIPTIQHKLTQAMQLRSADALFNCQEGPIREGAIRQMRLANLREQHAGDWLTAIPNCPALQLSNEETTTAMLLMLGLPQPTCAADMRCV